MADLVSLVVPVYNRREYLPQCVDSLLAQSRRELEILLVDNASTDGAGALCDEYARRDTRVTVNHLPDNLGASASRNWGIEHANGAFIGFVDSDDWIDPSMIQRLHGLLEQFGTDVAACGMEEFYPDGGVKHPCKPTPETVMDARSAFRYMLKGDHFIGGPCNKLYRAALFHTSPPVRMPEDLFVAEDLLFNAQLFARGATLAYQPWPLYHYRIHAQSVMRTFNERRLTVFPAWQRVVEQAAAFDPSTERYAKAMYSQMAALFRVNALRQRRREEARLAKSEISRYGSALLFCPEVSRKTKVRFVLMRYFPLTSDRLWNALRARFHLKWTAKED